MTLALSGIFKFQIKKNGRIANVKSEMIAHAEYRKVRAMIMLMSTQDPFLGASKVNRVQKKLMGEHCRRVTKKKIRPVKTVIPIAQ